MNYNEIPLTYTDMLTLRRKDHSELFYTEFFPEDGGPKSYCLRMSRGSLVYYCEVNKGTDEYADFVANRKPFCNKPVLPNVIQYSSHDMTDSNNYTFAGQNLYVMQPKSYQLLQLKKIQAMAHKSTVFAQNQKVKLVIWEGIKEPVPAFNQGNPVPTPYGPNGTNGWVKVRPTADEGPQEFEVFVQLDETYEAAIKVTVFSYASLRQLKTKASVRTDDNLAILTFPYEMDNIKQIRLRSSFNERLELYTSDNAPIPAVDPPEPTTVATLWDSYNEF